MNAFGMPTYFNGKLNITQTCSTNSNEEHKSQAQCYFIFWTQYKNPLHSWIGSHKGPITSSLDVYNSRSLGCVPIH